MAAQSTDVFELLAIIPRDGAADIEVMDDLDWDHDRLLRAVDRARVFGVVIDIRKDRLVISPRCWQQAQMIAESHFERTYN